jgi:hypothetical protein
LHELRGVFVDHMDSLYDQYKIPRRERQPADNPDIEKELGKINVAPPVEREPRRQRDDPKQ